MVKVFKTVATKNDVEYWATNDLRLPELIRLKYAEMSWMIETYHRGIKQFCGIERKRRSEIILRWHSGLSCGLNIIASSRVFHGSRPKFPLSGIQLEHILSSQFTRLRLSIFMQLRNSYSQMISLGIKAKKKDFQMR